MKTTTHVQSILCIRPFSVTNLHADELTDSVGMNTKSEGCDTEYSELLPLQYTQNDINQVIAGIRSVNEKLTSMCTGKRDVEDVVHQDDSNYHPPKKVKFADNWLTSFQSGDFWSTLIPNQPVTTYLRVDDAKLSA